MASRCPEGAAIPNLDQGTGIGRVEFRSKNRTYRSHNEGLRELEPKGRRESGVIILTKRVAPSIRSAVGWLYPLEHYDEALRLSPVMQYAELLLLMGSNGPVDDPSLRTVLEEARNRLDDGQYERLLSYVELLVTPANRHAASSAVKC